MKTPKEPPFLYKTFTELVGSWKNVGKTALIYSRNDVKMQLSYHELQERILKESRRLAGADADPAPDGGIASAPAAGLVSAPAADAVSMPASGSRVLPLVMDHEPETLIRLFAAVLTGIDVIAADPSVPQEILEQTAAAAAAECAADPTAGTVAAEYAADSVARVAAAAASWDAAAAWEKSPGHVPEGRLLFYTSGTTNRSRAVILTGASLCCSAWSGQSMLPCGEGDILLSMLPLAHVFGFVCTLLWGLCYGASVALSRGVRHIFDDPAFFRPTILPLVPSMILPLLRFDALPDSLRIVLVGAAPCPPETAAALNKKGIRVHTGYGLTETSSGLAISLDQDDPLSLYPCPGADLAIEEDGEISVSTPAMMQGYLGEPSPFRNGRFYTGDLGSFDEKGRLHITGRKKDMLVLSDGTKLYCPEREAALSALAGTEELAVAERSGRPVLIAGKGADPDAVRQAVDTLNKETPRSTQITDIIFLEEKLPRTAVGKLMRYKLQGL